MALRTPKARQGHSDRTYRGTTQTRQAQRSRQMTMDLSLIIITGIIGVGMWIIESIIYSALVDSVPRFLLVGMLFMGLALFLCGVVHIYSKTKGIFEQNILTGSGDEISSLIIILLIVVVIFCAAMLFQFIYGLNFENQTTEPTSYIFLIDDSGSMEESDPSQERYRAISDVLEGMPDSFNYMVYGFSNDTYVIREMAPISDGMNNISGNSSGGTAIRGALNHILDDYYNGIWSGGENPKVILLTDGYATDIGFFTPVNKVLKRYVSMHISVSTVGLGTVDSALMNRIAKMTGGVFVDVSNVAELSEAMDLAAKEYTSRDLLSARYQTSFNFLYGVLRVAFLTILGVGIGLGVVLAYGLQETFSLSMVSALATSFIGAIIMEFGTGLFRLSDRFMWLVLWIFIAVTIAVRQQGYHHTKQRALKRPIMTPSSSARTISKY